MTSAPAIDSLLRRDRAVVIAMLAAVSLLAWGYTLAGAGMDMRASDAAAMMQPAAWSPPYAVLVFFMWWIMMIAMMVPSAAPMVLLFAAIHRKQRASGAPYVGTGVFLAGYLAVWAFFGAVAALVEWGLDSSGLLAATMTLSNGRLGGVLLLAAGLYQLTPVKRACLSHCRNPVGFITQHWRSGAAGAFRMGAAHGAFCLGCCWFLMGLLFFGGVMNLYWIAGIATYVLVEKLLPRGRWLSRGTGILLILWGLVVLVESA